MKNKNIFKIFVLVIVAVSICGIAIYYNQIFSNNNISGFKENKNNNTEIVNSDDKDIKSIVEKVRRLMMLPSEEPLIAEVLDVENLKKEQAFYKDAQDGDFLLVYPETMKAILYRENENKIINSGSLLGIE